MFRSLYLTGNRFLAKKFGISRGEVSLLNNGGAYVVSRTNLEELRDLIRRLHPVSSNDFELIRLGPDSDGGYLIPDDLIGVNTCFSPGVSSVSGFEKDCATRGMNVHMADYSVDGPAEPHERFHFLKKYIGATSNENFITIDDWVDVASRSSDTDLLLQMDVEGAEYESLLRISDDCLARFRIMAIEFHSLDQLWNGPFFTLASGVFEKILQTHVCVHIHPNNCSKIVSLCGLEVPSIMEFTFLRKDRLKGSRPIVSMPNPLDHDCTDCSPMVLPPCWFSQSTEEEGDSHETC